MKKFMLENKRFLELLIISLIIIGIFSTVLVNSKEILQAIGRFVSVLTPFIVGFVIAYLLHPVVSKFEEWIKILFRKVFHREVGSVRGVSICIAFILLIGAIALLINAILPGLITSIEKVISQAPGAFRKFEQWFRGLTGQSDNELIAGLSETLESAFTEIYQNIKNYLLPNLENLASGLTAGFSSVVGILKNIFIGGVVAVYMLFGWEKFGAQAKIMLYGLVPGKAADWIINELKMADRLFGGFISGKIIDSVIIGVICFVCCMILQMPYALLVSVIVGVTNIIPFFGPYIGAIPSAILILIESPFKCVVFIIFVVILQQLDGNVIGPKILGDRVGISSFWILFAILFFGSYWGIIGMIVGVPLFGLIYDLFKRIIDHGLMVHERTDLRVQYEMEFGEKQAKKKKESGGKIMSLFRKKT